MELVLVTSSNITSVTGTLNNESVVFTQVGYAPEQWKLVTDPSDDYWYRLNLTITNSAGTTTSYVNDIYYRLPVFIFDRTQADVDLVKELNQKMQLGEATEAEKELWRGNLKGARNRDDIERILFNIDAIEQLTGFDSGKPVGEIPEIPWESYIQDIRDAVNTIRNWQTASFRMPETPNLPINTYQKMNDLEKILYMVYTMYKNMVMYYSDEIYCDEPLGMIE